MMIGNFFHTKIQAAGFFRVLQSLQPRPLPLSASEDKEKVSELILQCISHIDIKYVHNHAGDPRIQCKALEYQHQKLDAGSIVLFVKHLVSVKLDDSSIKDH